jgi:hypothetical protein
MIHDSSMTITLTITMTITMFCLLFPAFPHASCESKRHRRGATGATGASGGRYQGAEIRRSSENRVWFADVDRYFQPPGDPMHR